MMRALRPGPGGDLACGPRHGGVELPAEAASFVGRQSELARLDGLLRTSRLVTITGAPGVGKSRVALRAAREAAARYPGGVRLAELSGVPVASAAERLFQEVAAALGASRPEPGASQPEPGSPWRETVIGWLRELSLLLVLDTCEHVIDACAVLAETIVREAPGVTLLAVSRQPLDLPGEATFRLLPLPVPEPGAGAGSAGAGGDAVELFARRAAAAVPGFRVTDENRADVIEVCQCLDGLPLAIELAAVRLRALPLSQLASRCEGGSSLVTGGRRGTVDRHQTLAHAIGWSYDLCSPPERALWERLSVFAGPFGLDAAEAVCAGEGAGGDPPAAGQVAETIVRLVDKSVLLREPAITGEEGEPARYRLLGPMREFGARRLAEREDAGLVRGRLVARYAGLARSSGDPFLQPGQRGRYLMLRAGHRNITAALEYALDGQPGRPCRERDGAAIAASLGAYWLASGRLAEGAGWLSRAAAVCPGDSAGRARALTARTFLETFRGHHGDAVRDATVAGQIAERPGRERLAARARLGLVLALTFAGRAEEAAAAAGEAGRLLEPLGDSAGLCVLDLELACLASAAGDPGAAIARAEAGLDRLGHRQDGQGGDLWLRGWLHLAAALALAARPGAEAACAEPLGRAMRAARELGDVVGTTFAIEAYGWLAARSGRASRAAWLLGAAARQWEVIGARLGGVARLEELHQQAAGACRETLGGRFEPLLRLGRRQQLERAAALAAGDEDGGDEDAGDGSADEHSAEDGAGPGRGDPGRGDPGRGDPGRGDPAAAGGAAAALLTRRERQIAELIATGLSNREIAERMIISKRTVDAHVEHIFGKLRLRSRVQLTVWLRERSGGFRQ
jgi:predicted ATPase/DNA-binding CsgD family transcriptional regulator